MIEQIDHLTPTHGRTGEQRHGRRPEVNNGAAGSTGSSVRECPLCNNRLGDSGEHHRGVHDLCDREHGPIAVHHSIDNRPAGTPGMFFC